MEKTGKWYEGIAIGIVFWIFVGVDFFALWALFALPGQTIEKFSLGEYVIFMAVGPIAYILSLLIYPGASNSNNSIVIGRKCAHAALFAVAMIFMLFSIGALLSLVPISVSISPVWSERLAPIISLGYFSLLSFIEWRLYHTYTARFVLAFGFFVLITTVMSILSNMPA